MKLFRRRKKHACDPVESPTVYEDYEDCPEESEKEKNPTYRGTVYPIYQDMLEQPHLLIAGATGSGKSVVINSLIYTALFDHETEYIFIDPKRVELYAYRGLPQCIQYATEPMEIVQALQNALDLIDARYLYLQRIGERKWFSGHIYLVIDELADLMTTNKKQVLPLLQRICQIGRAAGVHVIAATQCPLASVIPTPVKVNFDARLGLRTRSAQDSRNIIGETGCESLPRYGKGIYMTPDRFEQITLPMTEDADIEELVLFQSDYKQWKNRYQ